MTDSQGEVFVQFTLVKFTFSTWLALEPAIAPEVWRWLVLLARMVSQTPLQNRKRF